MAIKQPKLITIIIHNSAAWAKLMLKSLLHNLNTHNTKITPVQECVARVVAEVTVLRDSSYSWEFLAQTKKYIPLDGTRPSTNILPVNWKASSGQTKIPASRRHLSSKGIHCSLHFFSVFSDWHVVNNDVSVRKNF